MSKPFSIPRFLNTAESAISDVVLAGVRSVFHPLNGKEVSITTEDIRLEMRNRRMRNLERLESSKSDYMRKSAIQRIVRGELYNRNLEILLDYEEALEDGITEKLNDPVSQFKEAFYERIAQSEAALREKFGR